MSSASKLVALAARWADAAPRERGNLHLYVGELCEALGVEGPRPAGSGYEYEYPVRVVERDGRESTNRVDLFKEGCFLLEAKDAGAGRSDDVLLRAAFGQARSYVTHLPGAQPPYLLVLDVGRTVLVWDRWSGSYGGYNAARRIDLRTLHERDANVALLRDVWQRPAARDPRAHAQAVTTDIARRLAELAAALEGRGFAPERVARFLMRVVFSCFAEDVGLLPQEAFRQTVREAGVRGSPELFVAAVGALWRAMDEGTLFGFLKLLRFNGHFFREAEVLPLTREDIALVERAAAADWRDVEPAIFGTLLTRALDPAERHRLGAEYTPRAYIERLVRPTVEEPIRERWTAVQAEVLQLTETRRAKDRESARLRLEEFHAWLRGLRFLDPACGSGNFLYVTMHVVKRVELEVMRAIEEVTGQHALRFEEVAPGQFHGIEVKPWAREIAELTLWIGFHQFWKQHHAEQPDEPVLRDTGTLECRDAVLAWDARVRRTDRDRLDPTPRVPHPVTGRLVPDPAARLPYWEYRGAHAAPWPAADFVVGNPPYLGTKRMRDALGDGYVDALRAAYPDVPDGADFVMYWWHRAAEQVAAGLTTRAGLITTNSIRMSQNRALVAYAAEHGARVTWAVADHPWTDGGDAAAVRVAMTVVAADPPSATLVAVDPDTGAVAGERVVPRLNADLTADADVATAAQRPLAANAGLSSFGFMLNGAGFILERAEADRLLALDARHAEVVRPYRNGRDLAQRPRGVSLIDFGLRNENEARAYPVLYDLVRTRVKPDRDAVRDASSRERWWQFARPRGELREALRGLRRYVATVETSKHRYFVFLDAAVAPDHKLIAIATDDAFHLGVLSSAPHVAWALAAGGRLGVGNDPVYNKTLCFDPFPFPDAAPGPRAEIAAVAEEIDRHRREALARDARVTMTGMYNVVQKLRAGAPLTDAERAVHDLGAVGVLRDLHDRLDRLVADAYGWPWPLAGDAVLSRLVALHDERADEEAHGTVRWLRPDYQRARSRHAGSATAVVSPSGGPATAGGAAPQPWPGDAVGQITALQAAVGASPAGVDELVRRFRGAKRDIVARHLETLAILGEVRRDAEGRYAGTLVAA